MNQSNYSFEAQNFILCRKDLDFITNGNFLSNAYEEFHHLSFFTVHGITKFWENEKDLEVGKLTGDILNSFVRNKLPFVYVLTGDESGIKIHIGTINALRDSLSASYEAAYPAINITASTENPLHTCAKDYGGFLTGIPTNKLLGDAKSYQIENICRGMLGKRFTYVIIADGIPAKTITLAHDKILDDMSQIYSLTNRTVTGGSQGNLQVQQQDYSCKKYFENLESLEKNLEIGTARGMWFVSGYYAADNPVDARQLGNLIKACYSGDDSKPEAFRTIEYNSIRDVIPNSYLVSDLLDVPDMHPLGSWTRGNSSEILSLYIYKFRTVLNSDQLATLCQLPQKEFPGYYLDRYVEFDVSNRNSNALQIPVPIGEISIAGRSDSQRTHNLYEVEKNDFTRHALVIGVTGGGKTNTVKSILRTMWTPMQLKDRTPFMVIESAKREYWELRNMKGFEDLLVFTLGSEAEGTSVRYRLNPFEAMPGVSLQTHIDYLLSTFKAAFELYPPMPYILETAVYEVYTDRGWDIVESINHYGLKDYPTLTDLYNKIDEVVDNMGYHQEVQSNVKAALQARIHSLMIGGKGAMLNTAKSVPIETILSMPVVMELEDLGDDETKSFVIGLLLVQLYEYRKSQMNAGSKSLNHILVVEEAHRLLKNVHQAGEGSSTQARSVEFFCNLLAEIRTFGQGIMIADQIPTKLASDTIKNTNLKIVHRVVAKEDREAIGKAMNMSEDQVEYLGSLRRGYAAVYSEGDNRPKCVKFPLVEPYYTKSRSEVIAEVRKRMKSIAGGYDVATRHHAACAFCEQQCRYYDNAKMTAEKKIAVKTVLDRLAQKRYSPNVIELLMNMDFVKNSGVETREQQLCLLGQILSYQRNLHEGRKQKIVADYLAYTHKLKNH